MSVRISATLCAKPNVARSSTGASLDADTSHPAPVETTVPTPNATQHSESMGGQMDKPGGELRIPRRPECDGCSQTKVGDGDQTGKEHTGDES